MSAENSVYKLETPDEKKARIGINIALGVGALILIKVFLPTITGAINNVIDFGIAASKLILLGGIFLTIFLMWGTLSNLYKSGIKKLTRALIQSDLPGLLEVVVANRRKWLAQFSTNIKKMWEAINISNSTITERKQSMQSNLERATYYQDIVKSKKGTPSEITKAEDKILFHGNEAAEDKKTLDALLQDHQKMVKSYDFFDRTYARLESDTQSVANTISRLRSQLKTSEIWKNAANSASKLLGVSEIESITIEETRNRIAANEAEVMSMIHDHEQLLSKMEADKGIMDIKGQELLDQYSKKVDIFAEYNSLPAPENNLQIGESNFFAKNRELLNN